MVSNRENDIERPQMSSKDDDKTISKKVKSKSNLKRGDPIEDCIHGKFLLETAFSYINCWIHGNYNKKSWCTNWKFTKNQ